MLTKHRDQQNITRRILTMESIAVIFWSGTGNTATMAQEVVAQADALTGALDQAGDVGADKACALAHRHNAQRGHKGGKVVVGDLGLGGADGGDEGLLYTAIITKNGKIKIPEYVSGEVELRLIRGNVIYHATIIV